MILNREARNGPGDTMLKKKTLSYIAAAVILVALASGPAFAGTYDFTLNDYNGKSHSLSDYSDAKAVVVIYVATRCPVSNDYNKRMADMYREFKNKDIAFIGINSNKMEHAEEVKEHAKKNGLVFPILKDPNNRVADRYKAQVTPEVYVLQDAKTLLYHGRIDDSRREDKVSVKDLHLALTEILAGKEVTEKETKAFGCTIKRIKKD